MRCGRNWRVFWFGKSTRCGFELRVPTSLRSGSRISARASGLPCWAGRASTRMKRRIARDARASPPCSRFWCSTAVRIRSGVSWRPRTRRYRRRRRQVDRGAGGEEHGNLPGRAERIWRRIPLGWRKRNLPRRNRHRRRPCHRHLRPRNGQDPPRFPPGRCKSPTGHPEPRLASKARAR